MTKEDFVSQLERGAVSAADLPVTSGILRWTADQLKRGDPPWWKAIAKAWEKRSFVAWTEAWSLYLTCLHFEALNDAHCELVPYFPSCGGTAEAEPSVALARFLAAPPATFFENLKNGHRRTYVAGRALMWPAPASLFFQPRGLSYYLVEVNAGAGVNLAADVVNAPKGFDSDLISARVGLDPRPLLVEDVADRRWLTAGIWPDNLKGIADLDKALEVVAARTRDQADFLQLAPCPPELAPAFITKNIPADDLEVGLLVYNMGTTARMSDVDYASYRAAMAEMLKPWGDRGLWIEAETVRGETYSTTTQLRAHRLIEGALKTHLVASFELGSGSHKISPENAAFFGPKT